MNKNLFTITILTLVILLIGCSKRIINLTNTELSVVNREIASTDKVGKSVSLNAKSGDGLAIIEELEFEVGTIEIELKGENTPGRSFVGVAFNIQNDSTYEAIYFRPFNFQSKEKIRREHSVQYISHPKNTWRFLRTNYEGQFESEFGRQPSPEDWFTIKIEVKHERVIVYDRESNTELLSVRRLENSVSNKIGLWTGNNSKGEFRNLRIKK